MLNINYCNSLSSANHVQVLISDFRLVQRRAIEEMIQPGSHKNNFANLAVVTIQTCHLRKNLVCKRTKISTTSTNLLYSIFARAKRLHRPGAGKNRAKGGKGRLAENCMLYNISGLGRASRTRHLGFCFVLSIIRTFYYHLNLFSKSFDSLITKYLSVFSFHRPRK